ncbi:hypothetical protein DDD63_05210 [Actinobaculum sp. 313]|nr:hypothetical protein DDD63_05210 [Actinobaculum sp. 313]
MIQLSVRSSDGTSLLVDVVPLHGCQMLRPTSAQDDWAPIAAAARSLGGFGFHELHPYHSTRD